MSIGGPLSVTDFLLGIVIFILGLVFSIAVHELGHLVPAKRFGVGVSKYMIGFGPTLFSRSVGGTEYGLKLILLGGFISIDGMVPTKAQLDVLDAPKSAHRGLLFYAIAPWKRVIVMFGGPFMNLVLALVFFIIAIVGLGAPTVGVGKISPCVPTNLSVSCRVGDPVSPASLAGLKPGDVLVSVGNEPATDWGTVSGLIQKSAHKTLAVSFLRNGKPASAEVTFAQTRTSANGTTSVGFLGMTPETVLVQKPFPEAFNAMGTNLSETIGAFVQLPLRTIELVDSTIHHEPRRASDPISIYGVGRLAGEVAQSPATPLAVKVQTFLTLLGSLNLSLFVLNLVPLLPLDGGHIALSLWQMVRDAFRRVLRLPPRGPVDSARFVPLTLAVVAVLIVMSVAITVVDIVNPIG